MGLAQNLLSEHTNDIEKLSLLPSSGGVFEVKLNDKLIFSKKELDRFPEEDEVEKMVR